MKFSRYSPSRASMICSSWPVPSVAPTTPWVSPRGFDRRLAGRRLGHVPGVLGAGLGQFDNRLDDRLEAPMAVGDRAEHDLLGQFLGFRFDHQHALVGAGDKKVELRTRQLVN